MGGAMAALREVDAMGGTMAAPRERVGEVERALERQGVEVMVAAMKESAAEVEMALEVQETEVEEEGALLELHMAAATTATPVATVREGLVRKQEVGVEKAPEIEAAVVVEAASPAHQSPRASALVTPTLTSLTPTVREPTAAVGLSTSRKWWGTRDHVGYHTHNSLAAHRQHGTMRSHWPPLRTWVRSKTEGSVPSCGLQVGAHAIHRRRHIHHQRCSSIRESPPGHIFLDVLRAWLCLPQSP